MDNGSDREIRGLTDLGASLNAASDGKMQDGRGLKLMQRELCWEGSPERPAERFLR